MFSKLHILLKLVLTDFVIRSRSRSRLDWLHNTAYSTTVQNLQDLNLINNGLSYRYLLIHSCWIRIQEKVPGTVEKFFFFKQT